MRNLVVSNEIMRLYEYRVYFVTEFNSLLSYLKNLENLNKAIIEKAKERQISIFDYKWNFCKELEKVISEIRAEIENNGIIDHYDKQEVYYRHINSYIENKL